MRLYTLLILMALILPGCEGGSPSDYDPQYAATPPAERVVYLFGVHPLHNPRRLFEVYQPLVDFINARLSGGQLRLEASRHYPAYDEKLFAGHFHFALPNPYQTVMAIEQGYHVFGKMGDDDDFRGIILVRKDSGIEQVSDLRGKTVSYPAATALAATMMPQWFMHSHGLDINKDIVNSYVGSQESSIMNVYLGKVAAGATWPPPWRAFIRQRPEVAEQVMIKWRTEPLPNNGLVVRDDVPEAIVEQVGMLLFELHTHEEGRQILAAMELSLFEPADASRYEPVRRFIEAFEAQVRPIRTSP